MRSRPYGKDSIWPSENAWNLGDLLCMVIRVFTLGSSVETPL